MLINPYRKKIISYILNAPIECLIALKYYYKSEYNLAQYYLKKAIKKKDNSAYLYFKLGMCYHKQKVWDLAFDCFNKAINLDSSIVEWHVKCHQAFVRTRIKQNLLNAPEKELDKKNESSLPMSISSARRYDIEEKIYLNTLENTGESAVLLAQLAHVQHKMGKLWFSAETWNKCLGIDARHEHWFYEYGVVCQKLGWFKKAADAYQRAIQLSPKETILSDWYYRLGFVLENLYFANGSKNYDLGSNYQYFYDLSIKQDNKWNSQKYGIGIFHEKYRNYRQAIKAYQECIQLKSENLSELHFRCGFVYDRNYQWQEAVKEFQLSLNYKEDAECRFRLAFCQEKQGDYAQASINYRLAAENRKKYTPYWYYRGAYCLEKQGFFEEAANIYLKLRKYEKLNQSFSDSRFNLLKEKLENNTTIANDWYELGNFYELQEEWQLAKDAYVQAIYRSNELNSFWYYRLGYVLLRLGNFEESCEMFRSYRIMQKPHGVSENILTDESELDFIKVSTYNEYYSVLKIKPKTVLYESFAGKGMSCNPYAIFLYLIKDDQYKDWTHIWVINDLDNIPQQYKKYKNVVFITRESDSYLRFLATASVLINNNNFPPYFIRKEGQKFLHTWHGTPFKTLGCDMNGRFFEHKNFTRNILQSTHLLSPNSHTSQIFYEKHGIKDIYQGKLIETGYPRIDLTLNVTLQEKEILRKRLGLWQGEYLIFYAPTWRGEHGNVQFDFDKLKEDIRKLESIPNAKIVFRGHVLLQEKLQELEFKVTIVPNDIDTNIVLGITDILITDYSSVLFDFLPTKKPLILYIYDYNEYLTGRGLYFSLEELPGDKCYYIDDVILSIKKYLNSNELKRANYHQEQNFISYDDGHVCERVVQSLFENNDDGIKMVNSIPPHKKSLLIYGGPFMGNGITTSLLNLINNIDTNRYTITLVIEPGSIDKEEIRLEQFQKLPTHINVIARVGRMNLSLEEKFIHSINNQFFDVESNNAKEILTQSWKTEYQRIFGNAHFDVLIQFEGYNKFWAGVFTSMSQNIKTYIFMHSSMEEEWRLKYPYLKSIFVYCRYATKVLSVSELTMKLNREKLSDMFAIPYDKFDYCNNLQFPERTIELSLQPLLDKDKDYFNCQGKVFITIGRLSVEKNHAKLIYSFVQVLQKYPETRLLIIGDGSLRPFLSNLIKELSLEYNVFLLGLRSNPFPLLRHADCFVLSSDHEGQPMTLFEAMVLDKMIISTDIPGSRSAIEGRSGLLVENSVSGLAQGMIDFIEGKVIFKPFDIAQYQKDSLNRFYNFM